MMMIMTTMTTSINNRTRQSLKLSKFASNTSVNNGCQVTGIEAGLGYDTGDAVVTMVTQVVVHAAPALISKAWCSSVNVNMTRSTGRAD